MLKISLIILHHLKIQSADFMIKLKLYVYHSLNKISMEILEKRLHLLEQMDNLMNLKIQF